MLRGAASARENLGLPVNSKSHSSHRHSDTDIEKKNLLGDDQMPSSVQVSL